MRNKAMDIMKWFMILCVVYIIAEAIVSLLWTKNDKWIGSQLVRVSRIFVGAIVIWASFLIG
jgi:hypothetical protein